MGLLTAGEESILLWRCDIPTLWLQTAKDVRILALEIVQKRDPNAKVDNDWPECDGMRGPHVRMLRERKPPECGRVRGPQVKVPECSRVRVL